MFPFQPKPGSCATFESIFFEHYSRLLEWALQLTRGDRSEAEDLVQELYVRFARLSRAPENIESAENYLFSVLRNLHYSRTRSARTSAIDDLSVVDYESAERGLRAVDRNGLLFIRADLHRICDFLCERKKSSRSASIFILRYFLGYFPNEVMKVAQSTRVAVDKAVQAVRREARLDLKRPGTLRQIRAGREPKERSSAGIDDPHSIFLALRGKIFQSCSGECFGLPLLESKYGQPDQGFTTEELAHLVSCVTCLDQANRLLGLPLLDERSPDETIARDTPQGPDASGQPPTLVSSRPSRKKQDSEQRRKRLKRSVQEVDQHRPRRLSIAVDGDIRASQKVTAQLSELQVELGRKEEPTFIEVLSEQGICLAFMLVQAPNLDGGLDQVEDLELSDDRTMKVVVSFTAEAPTIKVVYRDPLMVPDAEVAQVDAHETVLAVVPKDETLPAGASLEGVQVLDPSRDLRRRLWRRIRRIPSLNMNPLLASAMLFGLCSIVCFLLWTRSGPRISARTLLSRAEQSDGSVLKDGRPGVIYQKVRISGQGRSMERAIYRDPERKRRPKQQHLNSDDQRLKDQLDHAGVSWDEPLSAANYREWHDSQPVRRDVVTRAGENLLTLTTSTEASSPVLKESLTVRESDFHPVERTIELRDEGTVEVAELNYDVMPWGAVNQDWFEPLPGQSAVDRTHPSFSAPIPPVLSGLELDKAELGVRIALNQLHADTGEQIHVSRVMNGIQVKGIVDTDRRKQEILSRLLRISQVHTSILSVEEIGNHPQTISAPTGQPIQAYSVDAKPSPLELYMRERKLPLDQLGTISQSLLNGCLQIQQAQVHLSELQQRFKAADQLPGDLQSQLTELSRNYINAIQAGLDADRRTLLSLGLEDAAQAASSPEATSSDEDINQQVHRYQELCQELIANGTGLARPAAAIVNDLANSGSRLHSRVAQIQTALSTAHN